MALETAAKLIAAAASLWALRQLAHLAILRGLRVPVSDAQRLLAATANAQLLLIDGDHDLRNALDAHGPALVAFLHTALSNK